MPVKPFLDDTLLPPGRQVSPAMQKLADQLAGDSDPETRQAALGVLRLLAPFGDIRGLSLVQPASGRLLACDLADRFARRSLDQSEPTLQWIADLEIRLQDPALLNQFPELSQKPPADDNPLWATHTELAHTPAYPLLACDLHRGLIHLLARTEWAQTPMARKSLDARLTGLRRIFPKLPAPAIAEALDKNDSQAAGQVILDIASQLTYAAEEHQAQPRFLPRKTQITYASDCCQALYHPEWFEAVLRDSRLGTTSGTTHATFDADANEDDDPSEKAGWDRFRIRHAQQIEARVSRALRPGSLLDGEELEPEEADERPISVSQLIYTEELHVMDNAPSYLAWETAHINDAATLCQRIYYGLTPPLASSLRQLPDDILLPRALWLTVLLTGRPAEELLATRNGGSQLPRYEPEQGLVYYQPEILADLPAGPNPAADLYIPVHDEWVWPVVGPMAVWWQELARRTPSGERLFGQLTLPEAKDKLKVVAGFVRQRGPEGPALTEGRLRSAFTALMHQFGNFDPLLSAWISGQWRPGLRAPLFYSTLSSHLLAQRYTAALQQVWAELRQIEPKLPAFPETPAPQTPPIFMGSPYTPRDDVVTQGLAALDAAVGNAASTEDRHNTLTLKLVWGLGLVAGLRISEAVTARGVQVDLRMTWNGEPLPMLTLPETKGSRFTTAARKVPLIDPLLPGLTQVVFSDRHGPAFRFLHHGEPTPVSAASLRQQLAQINTPFPRFHAGRHWLRTKLLEAGLPGLFINAILGHQAGGQEVLNPYRPDDLGEIWLASREQMTQVAGPIGWVA